jgi:hypothetical protein
MDNVNSEIIMLLGLINSFPFCAIKNKRWVVINGIINPIMPTDIVDKPIKTYINVNNL